VLGVGVVAPATLALTLLLASLVPPGGVAMPAVAAALVWFGQIAVGLAVLRYATLRLAAQRALTDWPDPLLLVAGGLLASLALAPLYLALDLGVAVLGIAVTDPLPTGLAGLLRELVDEWRHLVLPVVGVALLLGIAGLRPVAGLPAAPVPEPAPVAAPGPEAVAPATPAAGTDVAAAGASPAGPPACLARLPSALGTDVIAVRSELQYLRVWTTAGTALVLGSLREVAACTELGEGLRPHRSWWVAVRHLRGVRRREAGYVCLTANGLCVPVSRRRQAEVVARFGDSATLGDGAGGAPRSDPTGPPVAGSGAGGTAGHQ
jgi:hypothetical protein